MPSVHTPSEYRVEFETEPIAVARPVEYTREISPSNSSNESQIIFDEEEFIRKVNDLMGITQEVKELVPIKSPEEAKVGTTYIDFISSFRKYFPNIKVIKSPNEVESYDLIIVPGGEDISPSLYGEKNNYSYINPYRDNIEIPIVNQAIHLQKKIFGSCRGHQLINVLLGGKLYQDFVDELGMDKMHSVSHNLENITDPTIGKYFGDISVVSMHHQAVKRTPLRITSTYKGIVESTTGKNIITTQFHPEFADDSKEFFNYIRSWSVSK